MVQPALTYGCAAVPLNSTDITALSATQSANIKTALGLPRHVHHSALLAAAGIAPMHELVRAASFRALKGALRSDHRLRKAFLSGLTKLAMCPAMLDGSLLAQVLSMCGGDFAAVMEVAAGRPHDHRVTAPRAPDGLVDSLRFLMRDSSQVSRRLLRLLTCPDAR